MKKNLIWLLVISPLFLVAQNQGIVFENTLTWTQILQKAKRENKYIFVDCFATWCGPCKRMDKQVYPVDSVGSFMNQHFICVKIQMDTTKQDNDTVQMWHETAHSMELNYHARAYPTYLFFSPDGEIVHKDVGSKNVNNFLSMAVAAMDPRQQYYTLLANYRKGDDNYELMPTLFWEARRLGQDTLSEHVAKKYIYDYLEGLPEDKIWTSKNIIFVSHNSAIVRINDQIFQHYYHDRVEIDSMMGKLHFTDGFINYILYRDRIKPIIDAAELKDSKVNWNRLRKSIESSYEKRLARIDINQGQIEYYKTRKEWELYIKYFIQQQQMNGIESWKPDEESSFTLNNAAYEVFQYGTNKRDLEKALSWVNRALSFVSTHYPGKHYPDAMDTKANLLYRLGKVREGLALEEQAHILSPERVIQDNYQKMKNGLQTWVVN